MKTRIIHWISIAFAGAAGLFAALELFIKNDVFGERADLLTHLFLGAAAAVLVIYYVIRGRRYKQADTWLLFAMLVYAFLVTALYYGFSTSLFSVKFYYLWCILLFCLFSVRVSEKPESIIKAFAFVYVLATCAASVYIVVHATLTLREPVPGSDRLLGCFFAGRLWGMVNANTMAFFCLTGILFAIYGCIKGKLAARIFYISAIVVLVFPMGLNNSRTANYALAFTVAAFVFMMLLRYFRKKGNKTFVSAVKTIAAASVVALAIILLLLAPSRIFRVSVTAAAKASNDQQLLVNVDRIYARDIADMKTLGDRSLIWKRSVELIFKNPRRLLFGTSVRSGEPVYGSYEGRHEVSMPFAHTMLLEVFRKLGLIGLIIWIVLLCIWGKRALFKYFDTQQDAGVVYLMAAAAGLLLTGITEIGPFVVSAAVAIPFLFFFCCGIAMRDGDHEEKALN